MSQVMRQRLREVREQSSGPAQAGTASSGAAASSSAGPRAPPPPKRQRSRQPVQNITAKADAIIGNVISKRGLGLISQASAAVAVAMLGSIPKAAGFEVCKQDSVVLGTNEDDGDDFWPFMISMLLNVLLVIAVSGRSPRCASSILKSTRQDAEASIDSPASIQSPVVVPSPPTVPYPGSARLCSCVRVRASG